MIVHDTNVVRKITDHDIAYVDNVGRDAGVWYYRHCPHCHGELSPRRLACDGVYRTRMLCLGCGWLRWSHQIDAEIHAEVNAIVRRATAVDELVAA